MIRYWLVENAVKIIAKTCSIYKSCVRPQLDYGDVIHDIPSRTYDLFCSSYLSSWMEKLEAVEYATALVTTGAWWRISCENFIMSLDENPLISKDGVDV